MKFINLSMRIICLFVVGVACCLLFPTAARAAGDFSVNVSDPDQGPGEAVYEGTVVYTSLSVPTINSGDNQVLGALRIVGKKGINTPVEVGNKVRVTLPLGSCYMQTPNAENYRHYVNWPAELNGLKNQVCDGADQPGIKFISGTPRSITVEVNHLDHTAGTIIIDFVFDQKDFSTIRVSDLFKSAQSLEENPGEPISRLDFFQQVTGITLRIPSCPLHWKDTDGSLEQSFPDVDNIAPHQANNIKLLVDAGLIKGYPDGKLHLFDPITRAEAVNLVGNIFPQQECISVFQDSLPSWATGLKTAIARGLVAGYPDGSFQPDNPMTQLEALTLLQNTLESYSHTP
ncbi:MAG TPA: S-layer homology domain-containing protein [Syntrophomonadaceae bacterium]|nr:S-layer homology domain-containing protein [Syntrophomonadaceae bacterium]